MHTALALATTEISFRPAQATDAQALAALLPELGYPTDAPTVQQRLATLTQAGDQLLVATDAEQVIGFVHLHCTHFLHRPPDGRIVTLVVTQSHRSHGIGAQLLTAAEEVFRQWGCGRIELSSGTARIAAHRFYCRAGYREQSKRFVKQLTT